MYRKDVREVGENEDEEGSEIYFTRSINFFSN